MPLVGWSPSAAGRSRWRAAPGFPRSGSRGEHERLLGPLEDLGERFDRLLVERCRVGEPVEVVVVVGRVDDAVGARGCRLQDAGVLKRAADDLDPSVVQLRCRLL